MEQFKSKIVVMCSHCNAMYKVESRLEGKRVTCTKCKKDFPVETGGISFGKQGDIDDSLLFCKIALNYSLVTENQLEDALMEFTNLNRLGVSQSIETIFVKKGYLTRERAERINDFIPKWGLRQREKRYAAYAVDKGFLSNEKAKEILISQAKLFNETGRIKWISEFLIESGDLTREQYEQIALEMGETVGAGSEEPLEQKEETVMPPPAPDTGVDKEVKEVDAAIPPAETKPDISIEEAAEPEPKAAETKEEIPRVQEPDSAVAETERPLPPIQDQIDDSVTNAPPASPAAVQPAPLPEEKGRDEKDEPAEPEPVTAVDEPVMPVPEPVKQHDDKPAPPETEEDSEGGKIVKKINGLVLTISADRVTALLQAPDGILPTMTVEGIKQMVEKEEISYGIVDDALIKGFLNSKVFREKPFKIAEGKAPEKGSEGVVIYHFDTDPLTVGAVSESGEIDFKDRGEIPYVKEGDLLAEITPPVIGKDGMDIYGRVIEVPAIHPIGLRCEEGAEFSEDHLKIYAKNDGQPKLTMDDRLYVLSELNVPGDVGFETGHIEFDGNIVISGTIQSDFTVKGANITANEVLGAEIIATGDLTVHSGATGATIEVEGNVKAKFINRCNIRAFGNVVVEREIIDSTIKNSGGCQVERGKIIASEISSKQGIEAVEIGTEMSAPSKFKIGVDDHINGEVEVVENQIEQNKEYREELKAKIDQATEDEKKTHQTIADLAQLQDRTQLEVTSLREKAEELKKAGKEDEVAAAENKIEALLQTIKNADDDVNAQFDAQDELMDQITEYNGLMSEAEEKLSILKHSKKNLTDWAEKQKTVAYIKTRGPMYAGTTIFGAYSSRVIKETIRGANIREVKNPDVAEGWEMKSV